MKEHVLPVVKTKLGPVLTPFLAAPADIPASSDLAGTAIAALAAGGDAAKIAAGGGGPGAVAAGKVIAGGHAGKAPDKLTFVGVGIALDDNSVKIVGGRAAKAAFKLGTVASSKAGKLDTVAGAAAAAGTARIFAGAGTASEKAVKIATRGGEGGIRVTPVHDGVNPLPSFRLEFDPTTTTQVSQTTAVEVVQKSGGSAIGTRGVLIGVAIIILLGGGGWYIFRKK